MTRPTDTQLDALVELCTACRVNARDVTHAFYQTNPRGLNREQVSDLCRLLARALSSGTWQSHQPLEALKRFAAGEPFDRIGGAVMEIPSRRRGESPEGWACRVFGLDVPREEECSACGGKGRRTMAPRILSRTALGRMLLAAPRGNIFAATLPDRLRRPPLHALHASHERLGPTATLANVIAVYEQLADMIEAGVTDA